MSTDYLVTVCASCLRASCWHGLLYCDEARSASTVRLSASYLVEIGREDRSHFSPERLLEVEGQIPRTVG